jgi:hypothetical protein
VANLRLDRGEATNNISEFGAGSRNNLKAARGAKEEVSWEFKRTNGASRLGTPGKQRAAEKERHGPALASCNCDLTLESLFNIVL